MIYYNYTRFEDKMKFFMWFLLSLPQRPLTSNHKIFIQNISIMLLQISLKLHEHRGYYWRKKLP